jgi:hypothetical protein
MQNLVGKKYSRQVLRKEKDFYLSSVLISLGFVGIVHSIFPFVTSDEDKVR